MAQQAKRELRQDMKLVLANLDKRWAAKAHLEICDQLARLVHQHISERNARHILAWIPCFSGEVDLAAFIGEMLKTSWLYLPRLDASEKMSFVRVSDDWASQLVPGNRKILQPAEGYGEPLSFERSEEVIVITPGIAFDTRGRRLGRGGGHYDRFLGDPRLARALKIGVCWSMQVVPEIPVDEHDISMNWLCHERGALFVGEQV